MMNAPFVRRRRSVLGRWLVTLAFQGAALQLVLGCGAAPAAMGPADMAAPAAPGGGAAPAPPPAPMPMPANVTAGYAPPGAPPDMGRAGADAPLDVPATYTPQAPEAAPQAPPAAGPRPVAPGRPQAAGRVAQRPPPQPQKPPPPPQKPPPAPPPKAPVAAKAGDRPRGAEPAGPTPVVAPLLIYIGDLQGQVDEGTIPATIDKVIDIAESLGGYLAGRKDTSVQVRIPSQRFREGFTRIEGLSEVLHRSVSADDVSEQYSDLEVRLLNLRATHRRLQEFLARSGTIQDMLTVGKELERVAGEMEQIEGKMRFLRSRAAFSLITVTLQNKPKQIAKVVEDKPPPPPREVELPIDWLPRVGLDNLLKLNRK